MSHVLSLLITITTTLCLREYRPCSLFICNINWSTKRPPQKQMFSFGHCPNHQDPEIVSNPPFLVRTHFLIMKKRLLNGSMKLCQTWLWNCKQKLNYSPAYANTSHSSLWYCDHFHPILGKYCPYYRPNVKRNLDSPIKVSSDVIEAVSEWKESLMASLVKLSWSNFQLWIIFPSDKFSISTLVNELNLHRFWKKLYQSYLNGK